MHACMHAVLHACSLHAILTFMAVVMLVHYVGIITTNFFCLSINKSEHILCHFSHDTPNNDGIQVIIIEVPMNDPKPVK